MLKKTGRRFHTVLVGLAAAALVAVTTGAQTPSPVPTATHGAVGSWFGKAIQICPSGVAPSACSGGQPALALFMTPTLTADGIFLGNDSLTLGAPPFGPHTTAHGQWIATSATEFTVDYTFMLNTFPPPADATITALRFRWAGRVVDRNTAVGFVNIYFSQPIPVPWARLLDNQFPTLPPETNVVLTPPSGVVTDPSLCRTAGCPLVFKFTIRRVAP